MPLASQVLNAFAFHQAPGLQLLSIQGPSKVDSQPGQTGHGHDYAYSDIILTYQSVAPMSLEGGIATVLQAMKTPHTINYRGWLYNCSFEAEPTVTPLSPDTATIHGTAICRYTGPGSRRG